MNEGDDRSQLPPVPGALLDALQEMIVDVQEARPIPLSNNVRINRSEFVAKLVAMHRAMPEEMRAARWMVREREKYVARTNERARDMLSRAKARSEEMVSDSQIVHEAVEEANRLVRNAEKEAERTRLEAEDHAERLLMEAETALGELLRYVQGARSELRRARPPDPVVPVSL